MKSLSTTFQDRLKNGGTLCWNVRLVKRDGTTYGYTSHDLPLTIDGVVFKPNNGVDPGAFQSSIKNEAANTEVKLFFDDAEITEQQVIEGQFDGATVTWFVADWQYPPADIDLTTDADCLVLASGRIGKVGGDDIRFSAEILTAQDILSQAQSVVTSPRCRATLGDDRCRATVLTFDGTVNTLTDSRTFDFVGSAEPAAVTDYCTNGRIEWLTGNNAGAIYKISTHTGTQFALSRPPFRAIAVGDTFRAYGGCNKSIEECDTKFLNALNFRGEPYLQGPDILIKNP